MNVKIEPGIYPMLYSFFDEQRKLRIDPFLQQVDIALSSSAAGVAILGLATEVSRLTQNEREVVLESVANRLEGRKPLLVTVFGDKPEVQIEFARKAVTLGASGLILQPPSEPLEDEKLATFFSTVIDAVDCPVGIQNAPEFLGFGLSHQSLIKLSKQHHNFKIAKLECTAVALNSVVAEMPSDVMVFNGRCGLELTDNLRAGADGIIPSIELIDKTSEIFKEFTVGHQEQADRLYTALSPVISSIMQGLPHLLTYGKLLAALRMGIDYGGQRPGALPITEFGESRIRAVVEQLGKFDV